jgi:predicted PurR-regulated permease PerM
LGRTEKSPSGGAALLGAGVAVFGMLTNLLVVLVLTVYFVADLPRIRAALYRLVPHSRRPRAILIGDEISAKVGGYVLGNLVPVIGSIIGGVMKVPALVTVVAVLVGGALLGVIGVLVAIPIAAALLLLAREVLHPRLDRA